MKLRAGKVSGVVLKHDSTGSWYGVNRRTLYQAAQTLDERFPHDFNDWCEVTDVSALNDVLELLMGDGE